MGIESIGKLIPRLPEDEESVYIHGSAVVCGDVRIEEKVNIWCNAVIRGDLCRVEIGKLTNIQDGAVIHVGGGIARNGDASAAEAPTIIGEGVSVGHSAIVHGCVVGDYTLIGMGAIVMSHCVIGKHCIIGAGALVTEGTVIPDGMMAFGSPARVVRAVTEAEIISNHFVAGHYWEAAKQMRT